MPFFTVAVEGVQPSLEVFRMGFNLDSGVGGETSSQEVADDVKVAFDENWDKLFGASRMEPFFPNGMFWQRVLVTERPTDPDLDSLEQAESIFSPLIGGSGSGPVLPPETSICVSLVTATPGRRNRGRMYLPAPIASATAIGTGGVIAPTFQTLIRDWAAALFGQINSLASGINVVVWSRVNMATKNVTRVRVGSQFDTQSRRQNSAPEIYVEGNVSGV